MIYSIVVLSCALIQLFAIIYLKLILTTEQLFLVWFLHLMWMYYKRNSRVYMIYINCNYGKNMLYISIFIHRECNEMERNGLVKRMCIELGTGYVALIYIFSYFLYYSYYYYTHYILIEGVIQRSL